jgi:hypothetical protein
MTMLKDKKVLAGGAVLLVAVFWFYIRPNYIDGSPPPAFTAEQIAAAPRPTLFIGKAAPGGKGSSAANAQDGVVLNLRPSGTTQRYVKLIMALEFGPADPPWVGLPPDKIATKNAEFATKLQPKMHKIHDAITMVLVSYTAEQVSTSEGKEQLKQSLIAAINQHLTDQQVEQIYFHSFIVQ